MYCNLAYPNNRDDVETALQTLARSEDTNNDPIPLLARALVPQPPLHVEVDSWDYFLGFDWNRPLWWDDASVRMRIRQHPLTERILRVFIRWSFPGIHHNTSHGASGLVDFIYEFADVSDEFANALAELEDVNEFRQEVIAHGAARACNADLAQLLERALEFDCKYLDWERSLYPIDEDDEPPSAENAGWDRWCIGSPQT